jgi:hypothetical protein
MKPSLPVLLFLSLLAVDTFAIKGPQAQENQRQRALAVAPGEQQMLNLADQRTVNIFIDSTDVPLDTQTTQLSEQIEVGNVLILAAQQYQWDTFRHNPNTFLFWHEPDAEQIALAVSKGQGYGAESGRWPLDELRRQLDAYVEKSTLVKVGEAYRFRYSQLPQDLQSQIASQIVVDAIDGGMRDYREIWLRDDLWSRANIFYSPPNPIIKGSRQTLFVGTKLQTSQGTFRVYLDLNRGGGSIQREKSKIPPTIQEPHANAIDGLLKGDKIAVLSLAAVETEVAPLIIPDGVQPAGTAARVSARSFGSSLLSPVLPEDERLTKPLTFKEARISLSQLVTQLAQSTDIEAVVQEDVAAETKTISLAIKDLPARDIMLAIARLYGLAWNKETNGNYTLKNAQVLPIDKELVRVGFPQWYRFREANLEFLIQEGKQFDALAAQTVEEAGPNILKQPGILFSSLPIEIQKKLRAHSKRGLLRHIVLNQIHAYDALKNEWSMEYNPSAGRLHVLSRGKLADVMRFPFALPPRTALPNE